jgi:hypothetical protein
MREGGREGGEGAIIYCCDHTHSIKVIPVPPLPTCMNRGTFG